jgi:uncharacterized OB-fold protein
MEERPFSDMSYEKFLYEGRLMGSRCKGCGAMYVPPRAICIDCYGSDMDWTEMEGKGRLAAFTCISIPPPFMIAQGYDRKNPYCTGVVELEEGARVDARIEGVDCNKPEDIQVGMPLKVKYLQREEEEKKETFLAFEPA